MRLLELECQNCGAALKIDKDTDTVSCPYCKASYKIDEETKNSPNSEMDSSKILLILIPVVVILVVTIVAVVGIGLKASYDGTKKVSEDISSLKNDNLSEQIKEEEKAKKEQDEQKKKYEEEKKKSEEEEKKMNLRYEVNTFNMPYSNGNKASIFVVSMLNKIIENNKTNKERIITVKYKDTETQEPEKILEISNKLKEFGKYDVLLDYDKDGFVNVLTIK